MVIVINNIFGPKLKDLIRSDNFVAEDVIMEENGTKVATYYHGDKDGLVDSYRKFVEHYLPFSLGAYTDKNKNFNRFVEKTSFQSFLKIGVHRYILKSMYKTLFRQGENDRWSHQSRRDKEISD
jgi:hypothetical protein